MGAEWEGRMSGVERRFRRLFGSFLVGICSIWVPLWVPSAQGQVLGGGVGSGLGTIAEAPNPLADTTIAPGKSLLFDLEAKFAKATAEGGGKAFATWFAEDGVSLANGQNPVHGRDAIAKQATWLPKDYQLTWTPTDAIMSAAGDMGYTWGHYEGRSRDSDGNAKVTSGRYLTIWRKEKDGSWKVVVDTSNEEGAEAGDCCKILSGK
jgi:ketosteroid isomerase-like protein